MKIKLIAPDAYWKMTDREKTEICNGCGGRGSLLSKFIPNGCFEEPCNIHDFMYHYGENLNDKRLADAVFLYNMNQVIKSLSGFKKFIYKKLAKIYWESVYNFGDYYFWKDKKFDFLTEKEVDIKE